MTTNAPTELQPRDTSIPETSTVRLVAWLEYLSIGYLRVALGAAFLSAVADRFGLWGSPGQRNISWGDFQQFIQYTAQVNSFLPASVAPALAWAATASELALGMALLLGVWPRLVAASSAALLALFGLAMAVSLGVKSPLDYSVFSASAGALLLAVHQLHSVGSGARAEARNS
jgi:putative oxidoreductase